MGLTVQIGSTLPVNVHKAKEIAFWGMFFSAVLGVAIALLFYCFQLSIIQMFTNDELVIEVRKNLISMVEGILSLAIKCNNADSVIFSFSPFRIARKFGAMPAFMYLISISRLQTREY